MEKKLTLAEKLKAYLETPEGRASAEKYFLDIAEKENKCAKFFRTNEYYLLLNNLKESLKISGGFLDSDIFEYWKDEASRLKILQYEYKFIFDVLLRAHEDDKLNNLSDGTCPFGELIIEEEGMRFRWLWGQGVAMQVSLIDKDEE